ncbi:MAG: YjbQ family protein [Candidatus Saganbacteria bacterium]|nr:YjbQ family protein [Candidatus Saganbacteria bacterium]
MTVKTSELELQTKGLDHVIDITDQVAGIVKGSKIKHGNVTVFIHGSTASVTTIEYEPGLVKDIRELNEKIIPAKAGYAHDATWGDANGYAHLRASLYGPSLTVPVVDGKMTLGTWQQVIVVDHDNRPRSRRVIIQVMGE